MRAVTVSQLLLSAKASICWSKTDCSSSFSDELGPRSCACLTLLRRQFRRLGASESLIIDGEYALTSVIAESTPFAILSTCHLHLVESICKRLEGIGSEFDVESQLVYVVLRINRRISMHLHRLCRLCPLLYPQVPAGVEYQ